MSPFDVWLKSFDVRLEACRQGGVLCSAILTAYGLWAEKAGIIAAPWSTPGGGWAVIAFVLLIAGVACAAGAHHVFGCALTQAALQADGKNLSAVSLGYVDQSRLLVWTGSLGVAEIACVVIGVFSAVASVVTHK
ncbi:MAG: hypothetical protein P4L84_37625 [Isosphaeraceae bacterium]|nr:hypothetical protein [Isosphaeraceae bacterium]